MPILYPSETTAVHTRFKKLESIIFLVKVSQDVMLLMDLPTVISLQKGYTQLFVCVCVHVLASIKLHALWQQLHPTLERISTSLFATTRNSKTHHIKARIWALSACVGSTCTPCVWGVVLDVVVLGLIPGLGQFAACLPLPSPPYFNNYC